MPSSYHHRLFYQMQLGEGEEDMVGSESSKHKSSSSLLGDNCFDVDICPDLILAAIATFSAAAFYALYVAITMNPNGRRRRRSNIYYNAFDAFGDVLMTGILLC